MATDPTTIRMDGGLRSRWQSILTFCRELFTLGQMVLTGTTTGSANAYVLTPTPALTAYAAGISVRAVLSFTNTGAATLNISGLGAKSIKRQDGSALAANMMINTQESDLVYDGTNFILLNPAGGNDPAGVVKAYTAATAPNGWLLCDGSAISRTTYAALFAITGTAFGAGDGSTTFNLPNITGRYPVGLPSGATIGATVGTALSSAEDRAVGQHTHTFTGSELAGHTHATDSQGAHNHDVPRVDSDATWTGGSFPHATTPSTQKSSTDGAHTHTAQSASAGTPAGTNANAGSVASTNAPYIQLPYIVKT